MFVISSMSPSVWLFWILMGLACVGLLVGLLQMVFWRKKEPWVFSLFFCLAVFATGTAVFFAVTGQQFLAEWFSVGAIGAFVVVGYTAVRTPRTSARKVSRAV